MKNSHASVVIPEQLVALACLVLLLPAILGLGVFLRRTKISKAPGLCKDRLLRRLRWVMACVILLDAITTLLGQPKGYWREPATAIEHNGLVRLFAAQGWVVWLSGSMLYIAGSLLMVSILPRRFAFIVLLSFILGHYFGACTWWEWHWGYGPWVAVVYGILLAVVLVLAGVGGPDFKALRTRNASDSDG